MAKFLIRRVSRMVFVLLVTSFGALATLTELGDPFKVIGDRMQSPETRKLLNETFGLDKPLLVRYFDFIAHLATGNLGIDFKRRRPVIDLLAETAPNSLRLALAALAVQVVVGITLGIIAARLRHSFVDLVITTCSVCVTVIPLFVLGVAVRNTFSGVSVFGWAAFPLIPRSIGLETTWLQELVLPALTLGFSALAFTVVMTRGAMMEVLDAAYVRTARAKGLTERTVIFKHAARNAMIPIAELSAISLGALMSGSLVIETIFQYPGIGYLFIRSLGENNQPVMLVITVYSVALFIIVLMLADILTAWLDPRIRTLD